MRHAMHQGLRVSIRAVVLWQYLYRQFRQRDDIDMSYRHKAYRKYRHILKGKFKVGKFFGTWNPLFSCSQT